MNERFFLLQEEKQNQIINSAYKVFATNSYKKAPMSEIADAGNISKALLFHYFGNKKDFSRENDFMRMINQWKKVYLK